MKILINRIPDVEEILVKELSLYLDDVVKFDKVFPNFSGIRISYTHPFTYLLESESDDPAGVIKKKNLFPSITVVDDTDQRNPAVATLNTRVGSKVVINADTVANIKANREVYTISENDLRILDEATKLADPNGIPVEDGAESFLRGRFVIEVWTQNVIVKNKLLDVIYPYIIGIGRFSLQETYGIIIQEDSISRQRSGTYNYDFGRTLYGGTVQMAIDFTCAQYQVDIDAETYESIVPFIDDIQHSEGEVHNNE